MSDKVKWAGIYLLLCAVPLFFYFLPPLDPQLVSLRTVTNFLMFIPYLGLILVAVLGWQVNQTRIFWSCLLLLGFYHYVIHPQAFVISQEGWVHTLQIVSAGYPLALCVIYLLKESRLWSDWSLARILLALFPPLLFTCLYSWAPPSYQEIFFWGPAPVVPSLALPPLAWLSTGLFLLAAAALRDPKIKHFLIAQAAGFVPFLLCIQAGLLASATRPHGRFTFIAIVCFTTLTVILLHAMLRMYWQKVYLDPLTAVSNRQALDERLHTLTGDFALAMVDIDHFKRFNDAYGHASGDDVLRMVAQTLLESLGDRVYRYGGEEFCVVFEAKDRDRARDAMEKARAGLEKRGFFLRSGLRDDAGPLSPLKRKRRRGKKVHITVSAGLAFSGKTVKVPEEVLKRADHALYEAKEKGRNRVVTAGK